MQYFKNNFYHQVKIRPDALAIRTRQRCMSYVELADQINRIADHLTSKKVNCIALAMKNSAAWIAFDLAAMFSNIIVVPVPHFFTQSQIKHLITHAGVELVITTVI